MTKNRSQLVATIPNGGTNSDVKTVPSSSTLLGIHVPAGMTGTALTFKAQVDADSTAAPLKKADNTAYSVTIDASAAYYPLDQAYFEGVQYVTIVSGTAEVGAKDITLVFGQTG